MNGLELILKERQEQIDKHGFSLEQDKYYSNGELILAAKFAELCTGRGIGCTDISVEARWPIGWNHYFRRKLLTKTKIQALTVAGAFYMAENERLGSNKYQENIDKVIKEINHLLNN